MRVAGVGFRAGASAAALTEAVQAAAGVAGVRPEALATLPEKAGAAVLCAVAGQMALPVLAVQVAGVVTPTRSARIAARFGTGSVAEAAALAAAGPGAVLIAGRQVSADGMATAAMAEGRGLQA